MFVTFGVSFAELRQSLATPHAHPPAESERPSVRRSDAAGAPGQRVRVTLPVEVWQRIVEPLSLGDALRLREVNGWCFDLVARSHRGPLAARIADASLQLWREPARPAPGADVLRLLLANERTVHLTVDPLDCQREVDLREARAGRHGHRRPRSVARLHGPLFDRLQAVLSAAPAAERVHLPLGFPFVPGIAAQPLRLPPKTQVLHLDQLCLPTLRTESGRRELADFFAANAERPVRHLRLAHSLGVALGASDSSAPLFGWRLTSLSLSAVPLEENDFRRLLRADFCSLRRLALVEDPGHAHLASEIDVAVRGPQLRALAALPWPQLERLELSGNFGDADVRALAARHWPALCALHLSSSELTNRSARTLAALPANKLVHLEVRGGLDLTALTSLLQPKGSAYTSLALMQLRPTISPRNLTYEPVPLAAVALDTPVRKLWLGQIDTLRELHVPRLQLALQPFGHQLRSFTLHTCVPAHEDAPRRLFEHIFASLLPDASTSLGHCQPTNGARDN